MIRNKRVIFYELNEVPRRVLEDFIEHHPQSTLARLFESGTFFETLAEDQGILSPWITWPTVHRGVSNERHCISDFGQDLTEVDDEYPAFTEILARNGIRVGVFGSLHTYPLPAKPERYMFYVPDTFANGPECFPETLSAFQDFNLKMVDASGRNASKSIRIRPTARFLMQAPRLGLSLDTFLRLGLQVFAERTNGARVGRRRTSQVQIAFDLFYKQLQDTKPEFCTFFTNHVASSMHRYWPAKYPHDYSQMDLGDEWRRTYGDEIDFTMSEADRQLARLARFVELNSGYTLVVLSSMGQAAVDGSSVVRTQLYISDIGRFMHAFGLRSGQWTQHRAMLPRYIFKVADDSARSFRADLGTLTINGEPLQVTELGNNIVQIKLGHPNLTSETTFLRWRGNPYLPSDLGIENVSIQDETGSYAYHVPKGILLMYDPAERRRRYCGMISTQDIAPTMLANFGVNAPTYMRPPLT